MDLTGGVSIFGEGLGLGFSLIVAIGAQNAFVLRQGLLRRHRLASALFCALADLALLSAGALGLGSLVAAWPVAVKVVTWAGTLFVAWYGIKAFVRFFQGESLEAGTAEGNRPLTAVLGTLAALTFLNPHVYLDTVLLLGGLSSRYPLPPRLLFVAGAGTASVLWFFALSFGSGILAPLFRRPLTWRVFDLVVGLIMAAVTVQLVLFALL